MHVTTGYRIGFFTQDDHSIGAFKLFDDDAERLSASVKGLPPSQLVVAYMRCNECCCFTRQFVAEMTSGTYNAAMTCSTCSSSHMLDISDKALESFRGKGGVLRSGGIRPLLYDGLFISQVINLPSEPPMIAMIRMYEDGEAVAAFSETQPQYAWGDFDRANYPAIVYTEDFDKLEFGPKMFFERATGCRGFHNGDTILLDHDTLSGYIPLWFVSADRLEAALRDDL